MRYDLHFTLADPDFYAPVATADPGPRYSPAGLPEDWTRSAQDVWVSWAPPGGELPGQGWKIHVSTAAANASVVVDVVASACVEFGVAFKHLAGRNYFLWLHSKHSSRVQSGKFCTLYPPDRRVAGELLRRLERDFAGVGGPFVLTDRRFGTSRCVSYRYGAFRRRERLEADGTTTPVMVTPDGRAIPDERVPAFRLPAGVTDPFAEAAPRPQKQSQSQSQDGAITFNGYTFDSVVRHSNAGGAYRAHGPGGTPVFLKEARAFNGYTGESTDARAALEREYLTLRALHAVAPGLGPEPLDFFTHWEHTYLATELVPGIALDKWVVTHCPVIRVAQSPRSFAAYYRRCISLAEQIRAAVDRLHALGSVFADLSPGNVLVDDDDRVRLIDFETVRRIGEEVGTIGTPGFTPPEATDPHKRASLDPRHYDEYAVAALIQLMLFPVHSIVERSPGVLDHVHAGLAELAPVPDELWRAATRFRPRPRRSALPSPADVADAPLTHLRWLRDRTADALAAMADPDHRDRIYPSVPDGYRANLRCVAYGTAGVVHALRAAGRPVERSIVTRLRDDSLAARADTAPGLFFGNAGIAWVLDDLGEHEAASTLLTAAAEHPLATRSATLAGGVAGVAMAELSGYCRTGDKSHLHRAEELLGRVPDDESLAGRLGAHEASGLAQGRPGLALALYYLSRLSGDTGYLTRGTRLLRDELKYAMPMDNDALGFRGSTVDSRNLDYLHVGSAGYAHVLARYLTCTDEPDLAAVLERCLRTLTIRFTIAGGLFPGQAGLAFVQGEIADLHGRPELHDAELDAGRALFKYAVPHSSGVRWTGGYGHRLSAELWSGSAGVLLALERMLTRRHDLLFTLDRAVAGTTGEAPPVSQSSMVH